MGVGKRLRINNHLLEKKNVRLSAVNLIDFLYHKQARVAGSSRLLENKQLSSKSFAYLLQGDQDHFLCKEMLISPSILKLHKNP